MTIGFRASRAVVAPILLLAFFAPHVLGQTPNSSFLGSRWDQPGPGRAKLTPNAAAFGPGRATYSIVGPGINLQAGAPDADHPVGAVTFGFDTLLPGSLPGTAAGLFLQAINIWQAGSGLAFTNMGAAGDGAGPIGSTAAMGGNVGDIRAAVLNLLQPPPVESQPMVETLAHAFQPDTGTQGLVFGAPMFGSIGGDVHFRTHVTIDPNGVNWVDNPVAGFGSIDLLTVMIHEVGHALGLGHNTGDPNSVMQPIYAGPRRALSANDMANITQLYTPEPGTIGLVAIGAAVLLRRRRRAA